MSKTAVRVIRAFQAFADTGLRGKITKGFLSGLLKLIRPRAKVIDDNLKIAYPDSSEQWRKKIRSQVYENLAWTITEALALQRDPKQAFTWVKKVHRLEMVDQLLDSRKGVIFLAGHFGNWELLASWYAQYAAKWGTKLCSIIKEQSDKDISAYIDEIRRNSGIEFISKDTSVMKLVRMLKGGTHFSEMGDVAGVGEIIVPFMGADATNMAGPAVMAMLSGAPIVPVTIYRNAPFEHEIEFFEPLKMPDSSLSHEERMKAILLSCNEAVELFIRKRPELWFWLHKRWRP